MTKEKYSPWSFFCVQTNKQKRKRPYEKGCLLIYFSNAIKAKKAIMGNAILQKLNGLLMLLS